MLSETSRGGGLLDGGTVKGEETPIYSATSKSEDNSLSAPPSSSSSSSSPPPPSTSSPNPTTSIITTATQQRNTPPPAGATSGSDYKTWKVVGIAVISVLAIGLTVSIAMFFDHWWRFMKDVLCCREDSGGEESLILDWEKATWEVKPSLGSSSEPTEGPSTAQRNENVGYSIPQQPEQAVCAAKNISSPESRRLPWETNSVQNSTPSRQLSQKSTKSTK